MDKEQVTGDLQHTGTTGVQRYQHDTLSYSPLVWLPANFLHVFTEHILLFGQTENEILDFNAACIFDCQSQLPKEQPVNCIICYFSEQTGNDQNHRSKPGIQKELNLVFLPNIQGFLSQRHIFKITRTSFLMRYGKYQDNISA